MSIIRVLEMIDRLSDCLKIQLQALQVSEVISFPEDL